MGHRITGPIGTLRALERYSLERALERPTSLKLGLGFIPLDHHNLDDFVGLNAGENVGGVFHLSPRLIEMLKLASRDFDVALVMTEYFGATGEQGAALFQRGEMTFGPELAARGVINRALEKMGVAAGAAHDAFEAAGLADFRSNGAMRPPEDD